MAFIHLTTAAFYTALCKIAEGWSEQKIQERLVLYSLLEDRGFAKMVFENYFDSSFGLFEACYNAGVDNGEIIKVGSSLTNIYWFAHHFAMGLKICLLNNETDFFFEGSKEKMVEEAIQFTLRGLGVTDEAIKNYFKSEQKKEIVGRFKEDNFFNA